MFILRQCLKALIITLFFHGVTAFADDSQDSEVCLAKAIYFESRGGSELDMKDVGHVVLNRVNSPRFPKSVCGVVYQRYKSTCQFSWACHNHSIKEPEEYNKSLRYANELVNDENEGTRIDRTGGALFFEAKWFRKFHTSRPSCFTNKQATFYK